MLPITAQEDSWDDFDGGWNTEPANMTIRVEYDYDRLYRVDKKQNNPTVGYIGVGAALWGAYLLLDDYFDTKKLQEKAGIELNMQLCSNGIYCFLKKRI